MKQTSWPRRVHSILSSLHLTVAALLVLTALVVWGTLYQVDNGIYAAHDRFFKAWLLFIAGVVPFPAVKTVIAILSVNLLAAALKKRPFTIKTAGNILLHIGVAILIIGSAISSSMVQESAITLAKGQSTSETYDFTTWQLTLTVNGRQKDGPYAKIYRYNIKNLNKGSKIRLPPTDVTLSLRNVYRNCSVKSDDHNPRSIVGLRHEKVSPEPGKNLPGVAFTLTGQGNESNEHYTYAGSAYPVPFFYGTDTIGVSLQPLRIPLPVRIELTGFEATWHPGTQKAKSFQSRLRLFGKNMDREVAIEMNRPFRYKDFTFYQMGYSKQEGGGYSSTLAIVKNPLRYLPYIASLIIVTGLFIHFFVKMWFELSRVRGGRRDQ